MSTPSTSSSVHDDGELPMVMDFLGDRVVALAQDDFDVVYAWALYGCPTSVDGLVASES